MRRCVVIIMMLFFAVGLFLPDAMAMHVGMSEVSQHEVMQDADCHEDCGDINLGDTKTHDCCGDECRCVMMSCASCVSLLPMGMVMQEHVFMIQRFLPLAENLRLSDMHERIERPPRV